MIFTYQFLLSLISNTLARLANQFPVFLILALLQIPRLITMKIFLVLLSLVGYTLARLAYQFPDGYLDILGREASRDFSCEDRQYGYYADVANDCKVFHICVPIENEAREVSNFVT